tara:strand:+ start:647 stop:1075 length:429 start_codon:yes stop_codon:yes gene_type:complete
MTKKMWDALPEVAMRSIQREAIEYVREFMQSNTMYIASPESGANVAVRVPSAMLLLTAAFGEALHQTVLETEHDDNTIDELQEALIDYLNTTATELRRDYGEALDSAHREPGLFERVRSGEAESSTIMRDAGLVRDPDETTH